MRGRSFPRKRYPGNSLYGSCFVLTDVSEAKHGYRLRSIGFLGGRYGQSRQ
jgi:hypothetical protein